MSEIVRNSLAEDGESIISETADGEVFFIDGKTGELFDSDGYHAIAYNVDDPEEILYEPTVDEELADDEAFEAEEAFGAAALTSLTDLSDRLGRDLTDTELSETIHSMSVSQDSDAVGAYSEIYGDRDTSRDSNERRHLLQEVASDAIARDAAQGDEEPEEQEDDSWELRPQDLRSKENRLEATARIAESVEQDLDPADAFEEE
jgi:hypothetical protein